MHHARAASGIPFLDVFLGIAACHMRNVFDRVGEKWTMPALVALAVLHSASPSCTGHAGHLDAAADET